MNNYGFPYQGSKAKIADDICNFLPSGERLCDLFGGGGAISHCAALLTKGLLPKWKSVLYNDLNPLATNLFRDAVDGKYNYAHGFIPEWISRDKFNELKNTDGYVKYLWSFTNNGIDYMFSKDTEEAKRQGHEWVIHGTPIDGLDLSSDEVDFHKRRIILSNYAKENSGLWELSYVERLQQLERLHRLQQLEQCQRLQITCGSYLDYTHQDGDIVYCDIPYENMRCDGYKGFDNDEFYNWADSRDYQVFFSTYPIEDPRFTKVWSKTKRVLSARPEYLIYKEECIYTQRRYADV